MIKEFYKRCSRSWSATGLVLLVLLFPALPASAAPQDIPGSWQQLLPVEEKSYSARPVKGPALTGGDFLYSGRFVIPNTDRYVLDFKNSSVIGRFEHRIYDARQQLVATLEGGSQSRAENPFFLRHGRELTLTAGSYTLESRLSSPLFLAHPVPYIDDLAHYQQAIKPGNAIVLIGLGIFLGLGIYYAVLSIGRRRLVELMYACFILGNTLYNATAHQLFAQLFSIHWIYLVSVPILFSNFAYILFVLGLLEIRREKQPFLYYLGMASLGLLGLFLLVALFWPNGSLEMARYGVGLIMLYGLSAGLVRARQGNMSARLYVIAVGIFFIIGGAAISMSQLQGFYALYVEHVGLLAVDIEVILLALVLTYQFAQLQKEKETILQRLKHNRRLAHTDSLTGLPNRLALDRRLDQLTPTCSLTFVDLDRLKYYNDTFGHARGDELLQGFASGIREGLDGSADVFRVGGDEFAIIQPQGDVESVNEAIEQTIGQLRGSGFDFAGASAGSARAHETTSASDLKHLADIRMYENKLKKHSRGR